MTGILGRIFGSSSNGPLRTADVFTIAIPTINYVARTEVEDKLNHELERCDRMICVTGPSKSGKTVVVRRVLPKAPIVIGQVGVKREDIWRHLCSIHNIPLRRQEGVRQALGAKTGVVNGSLENSQHRELHADPRQEFLNFIQREGTVIF